MDICKRIRTEIERFPLGSPHPHPHFTAVSAIRFPRFLALVLATISTLHGQQAEERQISVKFVAERVPGNVSEVVLTAADTFRSDPFALPKNHLSEPITVPVRAFAVRAKDATAGAPIAEVKLPDKGSKFVAVLVPAREGNLRAIVLPADSPDFRPGDVFFYNHTTAVVVGRLGKKVIQLDPGAGKAERPEVDDGAPYIDVAFAQKVGNEAKMLSSTRWPIDERTRGYVFFFVDPNTNRLTYRAVDEFVAPAPAAPNP